jgi:hypothetical protein
MRSFVRPALVIVALVGLSAGCQREVRSPLGERAVVKGKVMAGGRPMTRGTLVFDPVDPSKGDRQPAFLQGSGGEYVTSVFPGKYKVYVIENPAVPAKYQSPEATDLEVNVPSAGLPGHDIDLK